MTLRALPKTRRINGLRILVRVDWNIPLDGEGEPEASLKVERSLEVLKDLSKRGAIVVALTHLGRPKKREPALSTKHLTPLLKKIYHVDVAFHAESVTDLSSRKTLQKKLHVAAPGSIHLLENVRFETGEEKNSVSLAKAYASLADLFINDAFASCHRAHASVVGVAKYLPAFAGPALLQEVKSLSALLHKPKRPFVAVIGGKKLSTKLPVLRSLLGVCDEVMIGGAMAHPCFVSRGLSVGASYLEEESLSEAKKLLSTKHLLLPRDAMVVPNLKNPEAAKCVSIERVGKKEVIGDIGYATMKEWSAKLQAARTVLWNGPVGITEIHELGAGSRGLARVIGSRAKGQALGIAGGGDTIPVLYQTKTFAWFDFVSTGGGAMLEFLATGGKLPGLLPLLK